MPISTAQNPPHLQFPRKWGWFTDIMAATLASCLGGVDYWERIRGSTGGRCTTGWPGCLGGRLNIAHEAIDRHVRGGLRNKRALIWEGRDGDTAEYSFGQVKVESDRFANVLASLGIAKGDRILLYLDRIPELYFAFLGALKIGAVVECLFSGFGPEAVRDRMSRSAAKVMVTQPDLRRRMGEIIYHLFDLQHIVVVNRGGRYPWPRDVVDLGYEEEMSKAPAEFRTARTSQLDEATIHYTSGVTGHPKAVAHRHQAVVQQYATGAWVLDLGPDDVYWCTADPGWIAGTAYGITAPWTHGVTQFVHEGPFDGNRWLALLQERGVTVWFTSPTALRGLMEAWGDEAVGYDLSRLRHIVSAGETLGPDVAAWSHRALGARIYDCYLETETGAVICANRPGSKPKPGSIGKPTPGVELAVLGPDYRRLGPGEEGRLAARPGWPSMFAGYWGDREGYNDRFRRGWYVTGDRAIVDGGGRFHLAGRAEA